jgi:Kae1-associated kinase Bud32
MSVLARGAEAVITRVKWHGRDAILKERVPKRYRNPGLDARLRNSRVKMEAQLMSHARKVGVLSPLIYDIDLLRGGITMEFVSGPTAKVVLQDSERRSELAREIGLRIARLHSADMVHGDLTTSNIIVTDQGPSFIDFGLGEKSAEIEKKGVDLHLLKEALGSAHSEHPELFDIVAEAYVEAYPEGCRVLRVVKDIEGRGRYA